MRRPGRHTWLSATGTTSPTASPTIGTCRTRTGSPRRHRAPADRDLAGHGEVRRPVPALLVAQLAARKVAAPRFGARFTAAISSGSRRSSRRLRSAEATFGAGSAIPLEKDAPPSRPGEVHLPHHRSHGSRQGRHRVPREWPDLHASLTGVLVLTNHHVLHGPRPRTRSWPAAVRGVDRRGPGTGGVPLLAGLRRPGRSSSRRCLPGHRGTRPTSPCVPL